MHSHQFHFTWNHYANIESQACAKARNKAKSPIRPGCFFHFVFTSAELIDYEYHPFGETPQSWFLTKITIPHFRRHIPNYRFPLFHTFILPEA